MKIHFRFGNVINGRGLIYLMHSNKFGVQAGQFAISSIMH